MDNKEVQEEEREALRSIYEGDEAFKQVSAETYQYKYGTEDTKNSFLLEICWTENYPNELPTINMETFFNRNLSKVIKTKIISILTEEGTQWLGCGMTYTLFECLKDKLEELMAEIDLLATQETTLGIGKDDENLSDKNEDSDDDDAKLQKKESAPKKEQLTKSQKRKQWDRLDSKGNKPRGWDWVDIVKHLSQTANRD